MVLFRIPSATPAATSYRTSEVKIVVKFAEVSAIGEKIRADFYGLVAVFQEEVPLTERKFGSQCVVRIPLRLVHVSRAISYGGRG